jgi:hypothetical protein
LTQLKIAIGNQYDFAVNLFYNTEWANIFLDTQAYFCQTQRDKEQLFIPSPSPQGGNLANVT